MSQYLLSHQLSDYNQRALKSISDFAKGIYIYDLWTINLIEYTTEIKKTDKKSAYEVHPIIISNILARLVYLIRPVLIQKDDKLREHDVTGALFYIKTNQDDEFETNLNFLADKSGFSKDQVYRSLHVLESLQLISKRQLHSNNGAIVGLAIKLDYELIDNFALLDWEHFKNKQFKQSPAKEKLPKQKQNGKKVAKEVASPTNPTTVTQSTTQSSQSSQSNNSFEAPFFYKVFNKFLDVIPSYNQRVLRESDVKFSKIHDDKVVVSVKNAQHFWTELQSSLIYLGKPCQVIDVLHLFLNSEALFKGKKIAILRN